MAGPVSHNQMVPLFTGKSMVIFHGDFPWQAPGHHHQDVPELPKPEMHIVDMSKAEA